MLIYLLSLPIMLLVMVFCYITNPIVVLFCDECGELHGFWHLWQTWDDTCDAEDWCTDYSPKWMRYNYYEKYTVHRLLDPKTNRYIKSVSLNPGATFTKKERFLRYLNRVAWLTRNCAYGWAFYVFGTQTKAKDLKKVYEKVDAKTGRSARLLIDTSSHKSIWFSKFKYYSDMPIPGTFRKLRWNNYIGYKLVEDLDELQNENRRAMIANRIALRVLKEPKDNAIDSVSINDVSAEVDMDGNGTYETKIDKINID